jgi:hypothetical protein
VNASEGLNELGVEIHATVRAAILIASKYQVTQKTDGTTIRGCGLYTSMFLEGRPKVLIEDFHEKLQTMLSVGQIQQDVLQSCTVDLNRLTMQLNFY